MQALKRITCRNLMPRKLSFRLCARSGWEDGYSGSDISMHTPLMKGWRSQRFCTYPQELVLQLSDQYRICQLQLLSHQYLITSQVELYVGKTRLGHISMSNNKKSLFRQRELKSVHLDINCSELKLILHHNHINQLNLFNQVALIAINIIGEQLHTQPHDYIPQCFSRQASKFNDLAFAINQDPSIASLMLHLEKNKRTAVQKEKYKLAKRLKDCIAELQQVGEELAGYEVQKREAVQREDYNLAEEKRSQSEMCRQQAFKRLELSALLTESDALALDDVSTQLQSVVEQNAVVELQPIKTQDDPKVLHVVSGQQYDSHDDRPLPTLDKTISRMSTASTTTVHGPDALSKKAAQEADPIIKVFGAYTAQLLYSKHFQHRNECLDNITTELSSSQTSSTTLLLKALTLVLQKLLKDKVCQVFTQCSELLVELCSTLAEKLRLSKHDLTQLTEKVGHVLLHRLGDNTLRIRQTAAKTLRQLAELPLIKKWNIMDPLFVELPTTRSPWRQVLGQIEILHDICCNGDHSNIDLPSTVQFLAHCLEHTQQPIRTAAFDSLLQLYSHHGNSVRQKLHMCEEKKSSVVWRKLFESFDTMDGKPSAADIAAAKKQQEKENQQELCKLREQHKKLKAIVRSRDHNRSHDHSHNVNRCLFCDIEQTGNMEEHYLNCPMLAYCSHCKQMVEISGLTDHLLGECEVHELFHKCQRCGEAVHSSEAHDHHSCSLLEGNKQCCPFCHSQITSDDQSWKEHLMGPNSCSKRTAISTLQIKQLRTRTVLT